MLRSLRFSRRAVLVVLRLDRLIPVRRTVLMARSGDRVSSAERGHRRSEQPDQGTPARSRRRPRTGGIRVRAATESSNADWIYAELRGANRLGPPPFRQRQA